MRVQIAFIVGIVGVMVFGQSDASLSNPNGAIHARITANGLEYINQALKQKLQAEVNRISIPSIIDDKGHMHYQVKNIRIQHVAHGPSSLRSTPQGLRWQLSFSGIYLGADWSFRYKPSKWLPTIKDSGSAKGTVDNLRFDITLKPETVNGRLAIIPASVISENCASISDVDVDIKGSWLAWLYQLIVDRYEADLTNQLPPMVCKAAGKAIEDASRQVFPNMKTSDDVDIFDEKFLADYGLIDPQFAEGLANIRFRGEVFPLPKTFTSFPFAPSTMPVTQTTKHVYLVVSDFVANTLLYSANETGIMKQSFYASKSKSIKKILDTFCRDKCDDVELSFNVLKTPKMEFSRINAVATRVTLRGDKTEIVIKASKDGNWTQLVKCDVKITVSAQPELTAEGDGLKFDFDTPSIEILSFSAGIFNIDAIKYALSRLMKQKVKPALNNLKALRLPRVENGKFDVKDRELRVEDGALVVAANFDIKL